MPRQSAVTLVSYSCLPREGVTHSAQRGLIFHKCTQMCTHVHKCAQRIQKCVEGNIEESWSCRVTVVCPEGAQRGARGGPEGGRWGPWDLSHSTILPMYVADFHYY